MSKIYDIIKTSADHTGLPVMNKSQFKSVTEEFGKEEFRKKLADYVANERPPYPLKEYTKEEVVKTFYKLKKADYTQYIDTTREVIEKWDDYKYPYSKYGLGVIDTPTGAHSFINVSNYFMQDLRLACNSYGFISPIARWNEGTSREIWASLGPLWRGVNSTKDLSPQSIVEALRLGTYIATQFKPLVAKIIYDMTEAKTVLDTSMGWGDRLAAFYASNATHFL